MNIGVISSSSGGALRATIEILSKLNIHAQFHIVTDRECGTETLKDFKNVSVLRIEESDKSKFSEKAAAYFSKVGIDFGILFFTRLIAEPLVSQFKFFNFHPSLLPAFRGFGAIQSALDAKVKFFGTTLHQVDEGADQGEITAQAILPVSKNDTEESLNKFSFLQKVYLGLVLVEAFHERGELKFEECYNFGFNPGLRSERWKAEVVALDEAQNIGLFKRLGSQI